MGRPRKEVSAEAPKEEVVVEGEPVTEEKAVAPKSVAYTLVAWMKVKNQEEGYMEKVSFESKGSSVEDLLANLVFPEGTNCLVNVTVTHGSKELSKALAPHRARQILSGKSVELFNRYFKGL